MINKQKQNMNFKSFEQFVNEAEEIKLVTESVQSRILGRIIAAGSGNKFSGKSLGKHLYGFLGSALDKITDEMFTEMDPLEAKKMRGSPEKLLFWVTTQDKENPRAGKDYYYDDKVPANTLVALTDGDRKWFSFQNRWGSTKLAREDKARKSDVGFEKSGGKYGTGITNLKAVSELADVVYVLNAETVAAKLSTKNIQDERAKMKADALAMQDPSTIRKENEKRYREILANRYTEQSLKEDIVNSMKAFNQKAERVMELLIEGEVRSNDPVVRTSRTRYYAREIFRPVEDIMRTLDEYNRIKSEVQHVTGKEDSMWLEFERERLEQSKEDLIQQLKILKNVEWLVEV